MPGMSDSFPKGIGHESKVRPMILKPDIRLRYKLRIKKEWDPCRYGQ